jgi:YcxB-like protein
MTTEFDVTPDDIVAYNLYCLHHLPAIQRQKIRTRAIWGTIVILALLIVIFAWSLLVFRITAAVVLWIASVILINHLFFLDYSVKKLVQKQIRKGRYTKALGKQSLAIAPELYIHTSPFAEVKRSWQTTEAVRITDTHAFIFVDTSCAEIIPKRAFGDSHAWQAFVTQIQTYYTSATAQSRS